MTESDINKDAQAGPAEEPNADAANENGATSEVQPLDPAAEMARLEAEKADLTDRLLRVAADMDNLRRRTERDVTDARKYAVSKFAGDVLVVGDNLQRTLEALPPEAREVKENGLAALVEGVEMTARELERVLERHGVKKVAAEGARFDPNLHQAMFEVPDSNVPAGTVTQVIQAGYTIGDRVLRAALVGVSKGGPQAAPMAENQDAESEAARD